MSPRSSRAILSASMSTHQTSLPSSANPAAVTNPTYPVPITAIGSLDVPIGREGSEPQGPRPLPRKRRGDRYRVNDAAIATICRFEMVSVRVFEIQYTPLGVCQATRLIFPPLAYRSSWLPLTMRASVGSLRIGGFCQVVPWTP